MFFIQDCFGAAGCTGNVLLFPYVKVDRGNAAAVALSTVGGVDPPQQQQVAAMNGSTPPQQHQLPGNALTG